MSKYTKLAYSLEKKAGLFSKILRAGKKILTRNNVNATQANNISQIGNNIEQKNKYTSALKATKSQIKGEALNTVKKHVGMDSVDLQTFHNMINSDSNLKKAYMQHENIYAQMKRLQQKGSMASARELNEIQKMHQDSLSTLNNHFVNYSRNQAQNLRKYSQNKLNALRDAANIHRNNAVHMYEVDPSKAEFLETTMGHIVKHTKQKGALLREHANVVSALEEHATKNKILHPDVHEIVKKHLDETTSLKPYLTNTHTQRNGYFENNKVDPKLTMQSHIQKLQQLSGDLKTMSHDEFLQKYKPQTLGNLSGQRRIA